MSKISSELKYTKDHEWVRISHNEVVVGITDHAQNELTDIIFVELPKPGQVVKKGEVVCVVESVKSVSEVFSPVTGKVKEGNEKLERAPELVNKDPYGDGWLASIVVEDAGELEGLMSAEEYKKHLGE